MERLKAVARRLDARQFAAYSAAPPTRPEWTAARVALIATSAVLTLAVLGGLVLGVRLVLRDFPSFWAVPGLLLIGLAWELRPRLGRLGGEWAEVTRGTAPTLFALLDRIGAAAGAPAPHVVALDFDFNASAGVHGLRRRRRLTLGLPMWGVLAPGQRVALLAHEFGHFVNGDPARGVATSPALLTPGLIADMVSPSASVTGSNPFVELVEAVIAPLQRLVARGFLLVQAGLLVVASRDRQRAEYCADAVAVRLAGTDATAALMDDLVAADQLMGAVAAAERGVRATATARHAHPGPATWRAAAERVRATLSPAELRAASVDGSTLWDSHPPAGLRARAVESWPHREAAVTLSAEDSARIDAELARWYARAGRDLAWER
ncbi:M48 family metallopeptidase [Saccharothrix obliqua]|uniref:M48 family metallopeptidase n=1 Tax=Saccharothrix obliqua TaxID=2861747 RepID=UPI001C5F1DC3|nr:M48 family metallopeptidase [Saccharothrix obliqua]MBW4720299.1 M48 family metalloprotease [Saccharothrix obliqua]